jgi:tRNA nucleotidyltransferase/poly(A) polymerase
MMTDLSAFSKLLPREITTVIDDIELFDFSTGIVGGIPRDYLLTGMLGDDFDLEIRPYQGPMLEKFSKLKDFLVQKFQAIIQKYDVIKFSLGRYNIEITLPRLEHYNDLKGHDNFDVTFIEDTQRNQSFRRRDFTINAIMFEFYHRQWQIVDPLDGIKALNEKRLCFCSPLFDRDPVRFLRAHRFQINLTMTFDSPLKELLHQMDLQGLTTHYLRHELTKCDRPLLMLTKIIECRFDILPHISLQDNRLEVLDYDQFYEGQLDKHIQDAVFLSKDKRKTILSDLGFSFKGLLPSEKLNCSWIDLSMLSNDHPNFQYFYALLTQLTQRNLTDTKMAYLLSYYDFAFTLKHFKAFQSQRYELLSSDKMLPPDHYKYQIFRGRLRGVTP